MKTFRVQFPLSPTIHISHAICSHVKTSSNSIIIKQDIYSPKKKKKKSRYISFNVYACTYAILMCVFLSLSDLGQMFVLVYYAPNPSIFFFLSKK